MKKLLLFVFAQTLFCSYSTSQVLCVQCFDQNDSISSFVNNRIVNGGFEHTTCVPGWFDDCFCPNSSRYNCDIDQWVCTGGGESSYPSIFDNTWSIIPQGFNAAYFGNGNSYPCSSTFNDTSCMTAFACVVPPSPFGFPASNPGYGDVTGVSLQQTVSGLTTGQTYVLEFWAGGESLEGLLPEKGLFAVDVGFGRIMLRCRPTDELFSPIGTRYLVQFTATSTSHTIKFTNWGHACDACTELVLDDVRLYTLEELNGSIAKCITRTKETNTEHPVVVYPNPFSSELTIVTGMPGSVDFTLYDDVSHRVLHQEVYDAVTLNTSDLATGIYFYQVRDKYGHCTSGIVLKEK